MSKRWRRLWAVSAAAAACVLVVQRAPVSADEEPDLITFNQEWIRTEQSSWANVTTREEALAASRQVFGVSAPTPEDWATITPFWNW